MPIHWQTHYRDIAGLLHRHHTRLRAHARRDARRHHFTGKLTAEASRILQLGFSTSKPHARASLRSTRRSAMLQMAKQPHFWHIASCVLDTVARRQQRRRRRHSNPNSPERSSLRLARRSATSLTSLTVSSSTTPRSSRLPSHLHWTPHPHQKPRSDPTLRLRPATHPPHLAHPRLTLRKHQT